MSQKGKTFTPDMLPARARARMTAEQREAWAKRQTARNRIVAHDRSARDDRQAIIAEEAQARILAALSPKARRAAGMLARMDAATRKEVLGAFRDDGALKLPSSWELTE